MDAPVKFRLNLDCSKISQQKKCIIAKQSKQMYFFTAKSIKILPKNYVNYQQQYFRFTFDSVKNYMHDIITQYIILLFHGWLQNNVLNFQTHHNWDKFFLKQHFRLIFRFQKILKYFTIFISKFLVFRPMSLIAY